MLLYYTPGACSQADHIALREANIKFDLAKVDLKTHLLENGGSFLDINPKGYVPALRLDDGTLVTENIAILAWIAKNHPALQPDGPHGDLRLLEKLSFISTELHQSFSPVFHGAQGAEKERAVAQIKRRFEQLAAEFKGPYIFGDRATVADAYLFVMLTWAANNGIEVPQALRDFETHMRARPTVQAALRDEKLG